MGREREGEREGEKEGGREREREREEMYVCVREIDAFSMYTYNRKSSEGAKTPVRFYGKEKKKKKMWGELRQGGVGRV